MKKMISGGLPLKVVKPVQTLVALTVTAALSSCGLISNVIGEQPINDPFHVDNQEVDIILSAESPAANLAVQAKGEQGTSFTFSDQDFDLRGFGGDYIKSEVGLAPQVIVTKPAAGTFPESFTITNMSATLTLSDEGGEGGAARSAVTTSTVEGALRFNKRATCTDLDVSCGYTYDEASGVALASVLELALGLDPNTDDDLREAIKIIQLAEENSPNTATVAFAVTTDSNPDLAGSTLTVTLKEGKSVVKL